jgi:CcmD family protein
METGNKIYVVVAVLMVIFTGLISFLITIDRRLKKIEKELDENKTNEV